MNNLYFILKAKAKNREALLSTSHLIILLYPPPLLLSSLHKLTFFSFNNLAQSAHRITGCIAHKQI